MNITTRPCKLGSSLNTRTEKHGDDEVPACDIPIVGLMLEKTELDALVGEHFWNVIFNTPVGDGKLPVPAWPQIADVKLKDKFAGAAIIHLGQNIKPVELAAVTIKLDPLEGGLTEVSLTIQTSENIEKFVHKLIGRLATEIDLEITIGDKVEKEKSRQLDLPVNSFGDGEQPATH